MYVVVLGYHHTKIASSSYVLQWLESRFCFASTVLIITLVIRELDQSVDHQKTYILLLTEATHLVDQGFPSKIKDSVDGYDVKPLYRWVVQTSAGQSLLEVPTLLGQVQDL